MKFYIIILILWGLVVDLSADNTFPYSISAIGDYPNGYISATDTGSIYFIKNHILGEADFIYYWKDLNKTSSRAFSLNNIKIYSKAIIQNNLAIIAKEYSDVKLIIFDSFGHRFIDTILLKSVVNEEFQSKFFEIKKSRIICKIADNLFDIKINYNQLYFKSYTLDAIDAKIVNYQKQDKLIAASNSQSGVLISFPEDKDAGFIAKLPAYESISMIQDSNKLLILSGAKYINNTLFQTIDINKGIIDEFWLDASFNNSLILDDNGKPILAYLNNKNNNYSFAVLDPYKNQEIYSVIVKENFIEPYGLFKLGDEIAAVFRNGIAVFNKSGKKLASDFYPFGEFIQSDFHVMAHNDKIVISSESYSLAFDKISHTFWYLNTLIQESAEILIPIILIAFLIIFIQLYRHQKRFLNTLLDLSSFGAVIILKKNGKLIRYNKTAMEMLGITESVPKRKHFQYYCIHTSTYHLRDLVLTALNNKDSFTQKIMMSTGSETKEWLFNILPMRNITGNFRGLVVTGIDITAELEKKRLNNWAQLAHDMQTNLSTIKLNAEQLNMVQEDENYSRRQKIIHQVNILIQRVRDIVTVGRNDIINKQYYDAAEILKEVRAEFDAALFPNVNFIIEASSLKVFVDKPKMLRAIRNAIENGIRSLPNKTGTIRISNNADSRNAYFKITDSGTGMDSKTKEKMLTPYFTTGSKEGGSGIGTMIMQHVMELHGGDIRINSEPGKGTEIIFSVPNYNSLFSKQKNQNKLFLRKKVT